MNSTILKYSELAKEKQKSIQTASELIETGNYTNIKGKGENVYILPLKAFLL